MSEARPAGAFGETGVVEGFYGRVWREAEREAFIAGLAAWRPDTYLYAPKHEAALGSALLEPLDKEAAQRVHRLHHFCERLGIRLVAGLHLERPFDPGQPAHLERLRDKALALAGLGVGGLAVLLDDLPNVACPGGGVRFDAFGGSLAGAQAHAIATLHGELARRRAAPLRLVCPGRYTLDAALERTFGAFEPDYLARLHRETPREIAWAWTGPQVCPATVTAADVGAYRAAAGMAAEERPLVLWDNYPVNDAQMAGRLHLDPLGGRAAELHRHLAGYLFNPLLQPTLGALPGRTCLAYARDPAGYDPSAAWQETLDALVPRALHGALAELAALCRPVQPTGGHPPTWPRGSLPLAERLRRAWPALSQGEPAEPYLAEDLRRVLETLETGLPASMREEGAPWLQRLRQVLALVEALRDGAPPEAVGPLRAQYGAPLGDGLAPEVLGPWFP